MNIVPIKAALDIPAGLRWLADNIEKGEYGEVWNVAWVLNGETIFADGILGANGSEPMANWLHSKAIYAILERDAA